MAENKPAPQKKAQAFPVHILREKLRAQSVGCIQALSRSVARQTSYDALPCVEYQEEVLLEYEYVDKLLYAQNCRSALERCLEGGTARLRYRWRDGQVTVTRFRKYQGHVEVWGLQLSV